MIVRINMKMRLSTERVHETFKDVFMIPLIVKQEEIALQGDQQRDHRL